MKNIKFALLLSSLAPATLLAGTKPNILFYIADDHGYLQSEPYGNDFVSTPNMARISDQGLTLDRAYVASPASGPSRAALLSGMTPTHNGAEANHTFPRPETQVLVKELQAQGYEVAAIGKVPHSPKQAAMNGFDYLKITPNIREKITEEVKKYLDSRTSDKPLCLMVGDRRPHVSWIEESIYDIEDLKLPSHLIDTPETREHWGRYLTDIAGLDKSIGEVEQLMKEHVGNDDFLMVYTADHGAQWALGKWNLYDKGARTPMIFRWKDHIKAGSRSDAMVSMIDVMPTLIDIVGGESPKNIDGRSFKAVLEGKSKTHRDVIYLTHDNDTRMNAYPMRAVRSERYKYIRNLMPDCYHSNHSDIHRKDGAGAYWDSWDEVAKSDKEAAAKIQRYYTRPAEELYDLKNDPDETKNLVGTPKYAKILKEHSAMLDEWIADQGDDLKIAVKPFPLSGPTPHEVYLASPNPDQFGKIKVQKKKKVQPKKK